MNVKRNVFKIFEIEGKFKFREADKKNDLDD